MFCCFSLIIYGMSLLLNCVPVVPRWKLKVQQNLLRVIAINPAQSSAKTGEDLTKAAFTCETVLQGMVVVLIYSYCGLPPISV